MLTCPYETMTAELTPQWLPAPTAPTLDDHRIDVWRVAATPAACMTDNPRVALQKGQRAAAGAALRDILGRYLAVDGAQLRFGRRPGGKPFLAAPASPLAFNLSHTRDLVLIAVAHEREVGIDVEAWREVVEPLRLARRVFTAAETAGLEALAPERRLARFFRLWTAMEARQKALGHGLFSGPVDLGRLSSLSFEPGERCFASLATSPPAPDIHVRFFDYAAS
jgi:4'-phosphopantetheinyl transferase